MTPAGPDLHRELARARIERFLLRFGEPYRRLAWYAALPLVLTPDLLGFLRTRFLAGGPEPVPWIAESDLLLSDLCYPVGYEQYCMDVPVRACLIGELRDSPDGVAKLQDAARLLLSYTRNQASSGLSPAERQAEQLSAMVYLDDQHDEAARRLTRAFEQADSPEELERLRRLTDELGPGLREHPELLDAARTATDQLKELVSMDLERGEADNSETLARVVPDEAEAVEKAEPVADVEESAEPPDTDYDLRAYDVFRPTVFVFSPNAEGYRLVSSEMVPTLRQILKQKGYQCIFPDLRHYNKPTRLLKYVQNLDDCDVALIIHLPGEIRSIQAERSNEELLQTIKRLAREFHRARPNHDFYVAVLDFSPPEVGIDFGGNPPVFDCFFQRWPLDFEEWLTALLRHIERANESKEEVPEAESAPDRIRIRIWYEWTEYGDAVVLEDLSRRLKMRSPGNLYETTRADWGTLHEAVIAKDPKNKPDLVLLIDSEQKDASELIEQADTLEDLDPDIQLAIVTLTGSRRYVPSDRWAYFDCSSGTCPDDILDWIEERRELIISARPSVDDLKE